MNKTILGLLLLGALFALSGCNSGKAQNKYQQCLSAQKTYIKANKNVAAASAENLKAKQIVTKQGKEKQKQAAKKLDNAKKAKLKAEKALKAFNVENYALSSGDFCKWNVLCVSAREEWEKATAAAEKENLSEKEKEAADKALEKAEEKYESFNPLGLIGEHNLCD